MRCLRDFLLEAAEVVLDALGFGQTTAGEAIVFRVDPTRYGNRCSLGCDYGGTRKVGGLRIGEEEGLRCTVYKHARWATSEYACRKSASQESAMGGFLCCTPDKTATINMCYQPCSLKISELITTAPSITLWFEESLIKRPRFGTGTHRQYTGVWLLPVHIRYPIMLSSLLDSTLPIHLHFSSTRGYLIRPCWHCAEACC